MILSGQCYTVRGDTGGIHPKTRHKPVHGGSRLWLLLRSPRASMHSERDIPVAHGLWEYTPHIPAKFRM